MSRTSRPTVRLLIAAGAAALLGTAVTQGPADAATTTVRVHGTVSDSEGYPLGGVRVGISPANTDDDTDYAVATTDARGRFITAAVPVGSKKYRVSADDPSGRHLGARTSSFTATKTVASKTLTLADAGIIRGKVTFPGAAHAPAAAILVEAGRVTPDGTEDAGSVFTSPSGGFVLGSLRDGAYTLHFDDHDEDGTKPGRRYRPICYDNVPVTGSACAGTATVTVEAGQVTTINPQVMGTRIGQISGSVVDRVGKAVPNAAVSVYAANPKRLLEEDPFVSKSGKWSLDVDYAGDVKIIAKDRLGKLRSTWYVTGTSWSTATALSYDGLQDLTGIRVVLPKK